VKTRRGEEQIILGFNIVITVRLARRYGKGGSADYWEKIQIASHNIQWIIPTKLNPDFPLKNSFSI